MNNSQKDKKNKRESAEEDLKAKLESLPWVPAKSSVHAMGIARAHFAKLEEE